MPFEQPALLVWQVNNHLAKRYPQNEEGSISIMHGKVHMITLIAANMIKRWDEVSMAILYQNSFTATLGKVATMTTPKRFFGVASLVDQETPKHWLLQEAVFCL